MKWLALAVAMLAAALLLWSFSLVVQDSAAESEHFRAQFDAGPSRGAGTGKLTDPSPSP